MLRYPPLYRIVLAALLIAAAVFTAGGAQAQARLALVAEIEGAIGPATVLHVRNAIEEARERQAEVLILKLNTPGGLLSSTREIVQAILASPVPVVGYVSPAGAHAASAGTYILYATSVAAMAPGTNIGAATPIMIGGSGVPGMPDPEKNKEPAKPGEAPLPTLETKSANDAIAFIRGIAKLRNRNADWAEKAVREAATLDAQQALEQHAIDLIAADLPALLQALNGRKAAAAGQPDRTLSTAGIEIAHVKPGFTTKFLAAIANPNVALILMLIGTYGLIFELMNPGTVAPGVIGAISLILGLYALSELPLDYAGLALVVLGLAFMMAEAFLPTFGMLGFGGIAAFVIGAAMLIDTNVPEFRVSPDVIAAMAVLSAGFLILLMGYIWRSQQRKVVSGAEQLVGGDAVVLTWGSGEGYVWAQGERWHARGGLDYTAGQRLTVKGLDGLTLIVGYK